MRYPANYGYIPNTCSLDGDPVDVLVFAPWSVIPSAIIAVRPIGMIFMEYESGQDICILAVPADRLYPGDYSRVKTLADLPKVVVQEVHHFFNHFEDIDQKKWLKCDESTIYSIEEIYDRINKAVVKHVDKSE